jgi:hypothetical protein
MKFNKQLRPYLVGAQLIGTPPIYRPGKGIEGLVADKLAMCAINRHLRMAGLIC